MPGGQSDIRSIWIDANTGKNVVVYNRVRNISSLRYLDIFFVLVRQFIVI